ncbi:MAG TPA: hypothetical protein DEP35_24540 [Deltaproteobacteria bacterium]|jgi:hypothetical protein|nr:hypothetical protein [Deltaproteobacteria bacterium]
MARGKRKTGEVRSEMTKLVELVQREIEDGASSVEEIHKAIANLPLDVLERLDLFEDAVKGARKVQEARIGAMYDLIRKVNEEVGKIAKELLAGRPAHRRVQPAGARKAVHAQ